jgi:leucyl aminopeptidase
MENSMRFQVKTGAASWQASTCVILPVFTSGRQASSTREVDSAAGGLISEVISSGDIKGKAGETLLLASAGGLARKRILLVGCGDRKCFDRKTYRKAMRAAFSALAKTRHAP